MRSTEPEDVSSPSDPPAPATWKAVLLAPRTWLEAVGIVLLARIAAQDFLLGLVWVVVACVVGLVRGHAIADRWSKSRAEPALRLKCAQWAISLVLLVISCVPVTYFALCYRYRIRQRMAPLIAAIGQYHRAHHAWPTSDRELVPRYISAIPRCPYESVRNLPWSFGAVASPPGSASRDQTPTISCGTPVLFESYFYDFGTHAWNALD